MASTSSPSTSRIAFVYSVRLRRCRPGGVRLVTASWSSSFSIKVIMDSNTGASGRGMPVGGIIPARSLRTTFSPISGMVVHVGDVELIEHQTAGFQALIVARDAVLVEQGALAGNGRGLWKTRHGNDCQRSQDQAAIAFIHFQPFK